MDSVSPQIVGSGRGLVVVCEQPHRACAKVCFGIVDFTGVESGAEERLCVKVGTIATATLLPRVVNATGMEGGASSACQSNMAR